MNFWIVLGGSFGLLMFAYLLFVLVAFSGGALANMGVNKRAMLILNASLYLLSSMCFIAIVIIWYAYLNNYSPAFYWSFSMPLPFVIFYFLFYAFVSK